LSNDGLSHLLERTKAELEAENARIIHLEELSSEQLINAQIHQEDIINQKNMEIDSLRERLAFTKNENAAIRLSNDDLSLLLEKSQAELVRANARVTNLEEFSNELTLRFGNAVDLNSQLLVSEFKKMNQRQEILLYTNLLRDKDAINQNLKNQIQQMQLNELTMITIVTADQRYEAYKEACNAQITDLTSRLQISESNCVQMRQKCELIEDAKQELINQRTTEYQTVVERLDCSEKTTIESQKVIFESMGQVVLLESSIEKLEIENVGYILTVEENSEVIESRINQIEEFLDSIKKKDDEFYALKEQSNIDLNTPRKT
jgi:hypothetical protein